MPSQKANDDNIRLGKEILLWRKKARKTQAQVAEHLDITPQHISNYETGKCNIKYSRLAAIRSYLQPFISSGLSETQTPYVASDYDMERVEADVEALLARIKKLNGK